MKSLAAAGKFKKRKYKEENQKKTVSEALLEILARTINNCAACSQLLLGLV